LIVIKGADEGKQFELTGDLLGIGRDASNRIRLTDTEASRRHAELVRSPEGYRILDVGSANGTYVNNLSVRDLLLEPADQIQIGQSVLVYSAGPAAGRTASPPAATRLADQISLIARQDLELSSAIVKSIGEAEGSRILARPEEVEGPWLKNALVNLRVLYETTQAVSHILDVNQLLERILELIFRSLDADRGCVMLRASQAPERRAAPANPRPAGGSADGSSPKALWEDLEPKAVRYRDGVNRQEKITISRTIMEHVLRQKEGILVSDAARDERFQAAQSIVRFGIREIICVPMKGRYETLGVLYLDTRTPVREEAVGVGPGSSKPGGKGPGKFTEDHLSLAIAIAHQAALAVEETHYYQAMVQAERLAAVGQTIAALSHHIKNILQGLRSGGDILKLGLQDHDEALLHQGWKIVEKNQGKIYDLVMDMLSYSKEREPAIEETDLNAVVRDVVELMQARAAQRNVKMTVALDETLCRCPSDPEGIHRSLLNVVGNALDAVEDAAAPQVTVRTLREVDGVGGAAAADGRGWVRILVEDNGTGIPPEKLSEIFRPFVSTKGSRGTGLGLAVSRKILREHGGDILVQSQAGAGSTFVLRLPLRSPVGPDANSTRTDLPTVPPEGG
jgi:signal transduction histidine kinase